MLRSLKLAVAFTFVLAATGEARAQFGLGYYPGGYGGYGWGGWGGSTVQGNMARGLGYYASGVGQLREETAVANSINTDSVMRWNEFMYLSQLQANHNERLRMDQRMRRDAQAGAALEKQIKAHPTDADVSNGNALNNVLDQLTNPKIHTSALRLATDKIPGKVVRDIPFVNASEAVTISLDQLTAESGWPVALRDPKFDQERKNYAQAVDQALEEDTKGDISPQTLQQVRAALSRLKGKLEASPPTDRAQFGEAEGYLKTLYGMTKMLERPDVEKVVAELETIKETTLGSLLGFMHTFNLRFGRATTPAQKAAYESLYPLMVAQRDRVYKESGLAEKSDDKKSDNPPPPPTPPTDFFNGMKLEHLDGTRNNK